MKFVFLAFLHLPCLCAIILAAGCRRKQPDQPVPKPVEAPVVAPAVIAPPPGQPPPPIVSTRESHDTSYALEMTQTLNDFLGDYIKQHKRIPRDIAEMVNLKIITSVPVLPGGKKWVINQQTGKISAQ
ncbi:MAG: hypothetical protein EXS27_00495 [Pedosphaera sp.]|nr:hypothetical protein [Pedosphaera sp.]